ncbi:MAG TPA: hypothetical protein VI076_09805 [Actinopolymorphaceae bacterium]
MRLIKALASVATASALLVLSAAPASATVHDLAVTDGTLTTAIPFFFGPYTYGPGGTGGPCTNLDTDTDTLTIDETGTGTPTSTAVTGASLTSSQLGGTPSAAYAVVITKHTGNNAGTISSTGAVTQNVSLKLEFKSTTGAPTCVPGATVCTLQMNGTLTGTATAHPLTASTDVHLSGTVQITGIFLFTCPAPFAALIATVATVSSLSLHVTT